MKVNKSDFHKNSTLHVPQKHTAKTDVLKEREKILRMTNLELWEAITISKMLSIFMLFQHTYNRAP